MSEVPLWSQVEYSRVQNDQPVERAEHHLTHRGPRYTHPFIDLGRNAPLVSTPGLAGGVETHGGFR